MKVLVTGGAGFIGTNLVLRLLEDGHDVISIDKKVEISEYHSMDTWDSLQVYYASDMKIPRPTRTRRYVRITTICNTNIPESNYLLGRLKVSFTL